jgi:large conductance mechanosensitive channel
MWNEFKTFILRGNVMDLAVGIIMGAAFTSIVSSLVQDIIMPPIGFALGGVDFSDIFITLAGGEYPSLAAAQEAGAATINVGVFINAIINFLIVAVAVFFLIRGVNRLMEMGRREEEAAEEAAPAEPEPMEKLNDSIERLITVLESQADAGKGKG